MTGSHQEGRVWELEAREVWQPCPLASFPGLLAGCRGPGENQEALGYGAVTWEGAWVLNDRVEQSLACQAALAAGKDAKPHGCQPRKPGGTCFDSQSTFLGNFLSEAQG